jgi:hypothetical protein
VIACEKVCVSGDVLTGTVLTQCLQGSAQCFAGASSDVLTGTVLTQCLQGSAQCFAEASGQILQPGA